MKKISDMKAIINKGILFGMMMVVAFVLPNMGFAQPAPGGNPDGNPPATVPFNGYMSIGLIVVGIILAFVVLRKLNSKTVIKNS
jgi:hypothetical protein